MPRSEPALGTTWKCGTHRRLAIPVWFEGEKRIRHAGACDTDWCGSQRFTERLGREVDGKIERKVREVSRAEVLAALAGEDKPALSSFQNPAGVVRILEPPAGEDKEHA